MQNLYVDGSLLFALVIPGEVIVPFIWEVARNVWRWLKREKEKK